MPRTLISLGANLGNVRETMLAARRLLIDTFGLGNVAFSRLYRTPPVGGPDGQDDFLNAVVRIDTSLDCWELWEQTKKIESDLGRQRLHRWEARRIDVDILLYDEQRIWTPHLKVPHPRMCMRTFVIQPAMEIVRDWIDPVSGWTIEELYRRMTGSAPRPTIRVVCPRPDDLETLQQAWSENSHSDVAVIHWESATFDSISSVRSQSSPVDLTIVAVSSPDPTTILWEDISLPWVRTLSMNSCAAADRSELRSQPIPGPRYLLPANDAVWAIHEIRAAAMAMRCQIEPVASLHQWH